MHVRSQNAGTSTGGCSAGLSVCMRLRSSTGRSTFARAHDPFAWWQMRSTTPIPVSKANANAERGAAMDKMLKLGPGQPCPNVSSGSRGLLGMISGRERREIHELDLCDCNAWLCENGFYQDVHDLTLCNVCRPCPSQCPAGQWMSGLCTPVASGCSPCPQCPGGSYIQVACGGNQETVCAACTVCDIGKYANVSCADDADTVCIDCPNQPPAFAHFTGEYNASAYSCLWDCDDTLEFKMETSTCECPAGTYYEAEASDDPDKFDTILQAYNPKGCIPCTQCPRGTYTVEGEECSTASDRTCTPCPNAETVPSRGLLKMQGGTGVYNMEFDICEYSCDPGYTSVYPDQCQCADKFFTDDGGQTCTPCTECDDSEYTKIFCGATSDAVCETCFSGKPAHSEYTSYNYEKGVCDWKCRPGYHRPGNVEICRTCTECSVGEYQDSDCSANEDRVCLPCPNQPPQYAKYTREYDRGMLRCTWTCDETFQREILGPQLEDQRCKCQTGLTIKQADPEPRCGACTACTSTSSLGSSSNPISSRWSVTPCNTTHDTFCGACTLCAADSYVKSACTPAQNTVCMPCTECNRNSTRGPLQWTASYCSGWAGNSSANHLNLPGTDTACSECSPYRCPLGQHGVECTTTADTSCSICNNTIPEHAHWTGHWQPDHPSPHDAASCIWECNFLFEVLPAAPNNASSAIECVCGHGRYLHKFSTLEISSRNSRFVPAEQGECRMCKICAPGERMLSACNRTHNTVCTPCKEAASFLRSELVHHYQLTSVCADTSTTSPECIVTFDDVEADVELTIAVVMTDFSASDEYIRGVYVGQGAGTRVGGTYLRSCSNCKDDECRLQETILDRAQVATSAVSAKKQLQVRIKASYQVGSYKCAYPVTASKLYTLLAYVTISRARSTWDHDAEEGSAYDQSIDLCQWKCNPGYTKNLNGSDCVCGNGYYVNSEVVGGCALCSTCPLRGTQAGQMVLEECTLTQDTVCVDCCNQKPPSSYFTGEYALGSGTCEWMCNAGFYKTFASQNISNSSSITITSPSPSTAPANSESNATLPWACKYVFDGSVPGGYLSGVAYGDARVCVSCTKCVDGEYMETPCGENKDAVCKQCPNEHPDNAHFIGTTSNATGTLTCDWSCNPSFWNSDGVCKTCANELPEHADFTGDLMEGMQLPGLCDFRCREYFQLRGSGTSAVCFCQVGRFYNGSHCIPCKQCGLGSYASSLCSQVPVDAMDTTCQNCLNAAPYGGRYTGGGQVLSNGSVLCEFECTEGFFLDSSRCHTCSECDIGKYVSNECTSTRDTNCSVCPNRPPQFAKYNGSYDKDIGVCLWQCREEKGFMLNESFWFSLGPIPGLIPASIPGISSPNQGGPGGTGGQVGEEGESGSGPGAGSQAINGGPGDMAGHGPDTIYRGPCRCPAVGFYLDTRSERCRTCGVCATGFFTSSRCNSTADTVCTPCPNPNPFFSDYTGIYPER